MAEFEDTQAMPAVPRLAGRGHDLVCDEGFRRATQGGRSGVVVKLRLPSYRSLPLSCVPEIGLNVDGEAVKNSELTLLLDNNPHQIAELSALSDIWWFVLDPAELFAPLGNLGDGEHDVEVTVREIVPYATGGRMVLSHSCTKRLRLDVDDAIA